MMVALNITKQHRLVITIAVIIVITTTTIIILQYYRASNYVTFLKQALSGHPCITM